MHIFIPFVENCRPQYSAGHYVQIYALLMEIQYGLLNIGHYQTVALAITFEPDAIEMQTLCQYYNF